MNFFVINVQSNLVTNVIASRYTPVDSKTTRFIQANTKSLEVYYAFLTKHTDTVMDLGELMRKSAHVADQVNKRRGQATPVSQRPRAEQIPASAPDRETTIADWINSHPYADEHDLNDVFAMGITAARAYLSLYRL